MGWKRDLARHRGAKILSYQKRVDFAQIGRRRAVGTRAEFAVVSAPQAREFFFK